MAVLRRGPHTISPTAHYTGFVWAHHGLGTGELATTEGRLLHTASRPVMLGARLLGAPSLDDVLLARHRLIDHLLAQEIAAGRVGQVLELAAGMSPRGHSFVARHPDLTYVEADLPGMAERKQEALDRIGTALPRHRVEVVDVLRHDGQQSLDAALSRLDPGRGVAVVTEGLLMYLPRSAVTNLWRRIAAGLRAFPHGVHLSDLHTRDDNDGLAERVFRAGLSLGVRSKVDFHFDDADDAERSLRDCGFAEAALLAPADYADVLPGMTRAGARRVRVVLART